MMALILQLGMLGAAMLCATVAHEAQRNGAAVVSALWKLAAILCLAALVASVVQDNWHLFTPSKAAASRAQVAA